MEHILAGTMALHNQYTNSTPLFLLVLLIAAGVAFWGFSRKKKR